MSAPEPASLIERIAECFGGTIDGDRANDCVIAGQVAHAYLTADGGFAVSTPGGTSYAGSEVTRTYTRAELKRFVIMSLGLEKELAAANDNLPVDPWAERARPTLPAGLLPLVIEQFAESRGRQMGVDPGGLAMAALTVCAAAIPDTVRLQVKAHDPSWTEPARLWTCLVGSPSAKKSPVLRAATAPLAAIDADQVRDYMAALIAHGQVAKAERGPPPPQVRSILNDTTIEAAQEVLKDNPQGLLVFRDELSGWFGSMEKYGAAKGAATDRAFWLEAFNGGPSTTNRVGRGVVHVPNLSVSLLGGIQPEPIRALANDSHDDGLLQRILPIVLGSAEVGEDEAPCASARDYTDLVHRMRTMGNPRRMAGPVPIEGPLRFSADAQDTRHDCEVKHHHMVQIWEPVNRKLAAHIGKYDSFFARLCVVFHCIECDGSNPGIEISVEVADRVRSFLHDFLFKHAFAFYSNVLGMTDQHDALLATAGFILAHNVTEITARDIRRGDRTMRSMTDDQIADVFRQLDAISWLEPIELQRNQHAVRYKVRPAVHEHFEERADQEENRREAARAAIASATRLS